ncbi:uncharacterized protein [Clytia hemisphaerica]|uniref:uncharacterized protein isoform X1 n=1 Tax=Clytia hemisphaerica TaxID=252671 RepID=UPI0034D57697
MSLHFHTCHIVFIWGNQKVNPQEEPSTFVMECSKTIEHILAAANVDNCMYFKDDAKKLCPKIPLQDKRIYEEGDEAAEYIELSYNELPIGASIFAVSYMFTNSSSSSSSSSSTEKKPAQTLDIFIDAVLHSIKLLSNGSTNERLTSYFDKAISPARNDGAVDIDISGSPREKLPQFLAFHFVKIEEDYCASKKCLDKIDLLIKEGCPDIANLTSVYVPCFDNPMYYQIPIMTDMVYPAPGSNLTSSSDFKIIFKFYSDKRIREFQNNSKIEIVNNENTTILEIPTSPCPPEYECSIDTGHFTVIFLNDAPFENMTEYFIRFQNTTVKTQDNIVGHIVTRKTWNFVYLSFKEKDKETIKDSDSFTSSCGKDTMTLNLTKKYLPIPKEDDDYDISWQDISCNKTLDNGGSLTLKTGYTKCGTTSHIEDDVIIFRNRVTIRQKGKKISKAHLEDEWEYGSYVVECKIPNNVNISTSVLNITMKDTISSRISSNDKFKMEMKLYETNKYSTPLSYPVVKTLNDRINMKIELFSTSSLSIYPQNCFATPSQNRNHPMKEFLVKDRCITKEHSMVSLKKAKELEVSFDAFRFRNTSGIIYIHCSVLICLAKNNGVGDCAFECDGGSSRRKRSAGVRNPRSR